jgi:predicted metal-dependent hydrolase
MHKLAHLLVTNHGKLFRSFGHAYLPKWEAREQQLRTYHTE